jgi:hypothetical protein
LKHMILLSRKPQQADDFTTGQKLALFSGISNALANFYTAKETPIPDETTEDV